MLSETTTDSSVVDIPSSVTVVTRHYSPEPTGSAPVIQEIAEWLSASGASVKVITVRPSYPEKRILPGYALGERDHAVEGGVDVRRLPTSPVANAGLLARVWPEFRFMLDLAARRLRGEFVPDGAVVSLCPSILTVTGALFLVKRGGRHVAVVHDIPSGLGSALGLKRSGIVLSVLRLIESWTLNQVDSVVVLSADMESALRAMKVTTDIVVLPPHINTKSIRPRSRPDGAPPTLMYSGNLGRKQGLEQVLGMAHIIRERAPEVRILIRGEGAVRQKLVETAARDNLTNMSFEPLVPKDQVALSMSEGDVHLVPQLPEGQEFAVPSKAFAIMAAGRPFVATAAENSPLEVLTKSTGAGICTVPGNVEMFATEALKLLADPDRRTRMGLAGRRYAEDHVDTDVVMTRLVQLLT